MTSWAWIASGRVREPQAPKHLLSLWVGLKTLQAPSHGGHSPAPQGDGGPHQTGSWSGQPPPHPGQTAYNRHQAAGSAPAAMAPGRGLTDPLRLLKIETPLGIKGREEVHHSDQRDLFCRQAKDDKATGRQQGLKGK